MAITVNVVDKVSAVDSRKSARERLWNKYDHRGHDEEESQDDSVLISEEARKRSEGKHRKTILEHLAEKED